MGKIKDKLLELEGEGIIEWSDELKTYVLVESDKTKPFLLTEYLISIKK